MLDVNGIKVEVKPQLPKINGALFGGTTSSISQLKQSICEHQAAIVQGIYLSLEHHKNMRLAYEAGDFIKARLSMYNLDTVINRNFESAWKSTVDFFKSYFQSDRDFQYMPRLCLKGSPADSEGEEVVDIYRAGGKTTGKKYKLKENTAFDAAKNNGKPYRCNDIPTAAYNGEYINPRLNNNKASQYTGNANFLKNFFRKKQEVSTAWSDCWFDKKADSEPNEFYRSTLVIPLTLIGNSLDREFLDSTIIGITRDAQRKVYGFLCFDHPSINYFKEDDVDIGFIFADLLTFHLINRQVLIQASEISASLRT